MMPSVFAAIVEDAIRMFDRLGGAPIPGSPVPGSFVRHEPLWQDIWEGEGPLLSRTLELLLGAEPLGKEPLYELAWRMVELSCPFHLSQVLFESAFHRDFDLRMECLRRDLPFLLSPELLFGEVNEFAFKLWLRRTQADRIGRALRAYEQGNGFPVLRTDFAAEWYGGAVNHVIAGWLHVEKQGRIIR